MTTTFKFLVKNIKNYIGQKGGKWTALGSAFSLETCQSIGHHARIQKSSDELQNPFVPDAFGKKGHQYVMIDAIKELLQVNVHNPTISCLYVFLRPGNCLVSGSIRTKSKTAVRKGRVDIPLKDLKDHLLNISIQNSGNT
jgi:hypothetical protein